MIAGVLNRPPAVRITSPKGGTWPPLVRLEYELSDAESDAVDLDVRYSSDGGATFRAAREASGVGSEGVKGLRSRPSGLAHRFVWNAAADLAALPAKGVLLRIATSEGSRAGGQATTQPFDVSAPITAPPPPPPPPPPPVPTPTPGAPELVVFQPVSNLGPQVPIRFLVGSPDNEPVDVDVEYSDGTGGFVAAQPAVNSDRMIGLAAPYLLAEHRFVWNAAGAKKGPAQVRLTAKKPGNPGVNKQATASCTVDPTPASPPAPWVPTVPVDARLEIFDGDKQTGVCGHYLKKDMVVRLLDSQKQPLVHAYVGFTAFMGGKQYGVTTIVSTDTEGKAKCELIGKLEAGAGTSEARVIGVPGQVVTFQYTLEASKVLPFQFSATNPPHAAYGAPYSFSVYCDKYEDLPLAAVDLTITAKSAKGNDPVVVNASGELEQIGFSPWRIWRFTVIPVEPKDTISIEIKNANDTTVTPLKLDLPVDELPGLRRTGLTDYTPYGLSLRPATAVTAKTSIVGCYEMTLETPFSVKLVDPAGNPLTLAAKGDYTGCVTPQTRKLQVEWTVLDGAGWLSDTPGVGADSTLSLDIDKPVYLTPSTGMTRGVRPWILQARVSDWVHDPHPLQFQDANGACVRDNVFTPMGSAGGIYCFVIRPPKVELTTGTGSKKKSVDKLKAGDRVRVEISGLSPTLAAAQPPRLRISSRGGDLDRFNGGSLPSFVDFTPTKPKPDLLTSDEILVTQGDPAIKTASPLVFAAAPWGTVGVGLAGLFDLIPALTFQGIVFERKHSGPFLGSMQESPTGTSSTGGAFGTVVLRNGEFVYNANDLDYATRAQPVAVARTFRSQARYDGPFGPGWFFNHGQWLSVADDLSLRRWISSNGRYAELWTNRPPPKGVFLSYKQNFVFDADSGPYQVTDAHKNELHFNPDGSVRLSKDRLGNFYRYTYDENARLVELKDPHARVLTCEYWQDGDPVEPETVGKVKRVVDFSGRAVDYEYYGKNDPNGAPGYLKKVSLPEAPTLLTGASAPDPAYRRSETYVYAIDPKDRLNAQLLQVIDSEGVAWIVNRYDSDSRVREQDFGGGTFQFDFDLTKLTTTVTDRGKNVSIYTFPESPCPDGAAPSKVEVRPSGIRPGAGSSTYVFEHNRHGSLVRIVNPGGEETLFTYFDTPGQEVRHGNLLALRRKAKTGETRTWSYDYEDQYNFVTRTVDPRGNVPGVNPRQYAVDYRYDYQLGHGSHGNLERIVLPRVTNMVIGPPGSSDRQRWVEENPTVVRTYNDYGLLARETDPMGVVTEYRYYSSDDPTGKGGQPSPAGGGFLGDRVRDVDQNATRDAHLFNLPLEPRTTRWRYNALGDPRELEDPRGVVTVVTAGGLHEVNAVVDAARAPAPLQALSITRRFDMDARGRLARDRLEQPSCAGDAGAGGGELVTLYGYDAAGNVLKEQATVAQGEDATAKWLRDANDMPLRFRPVDADSGRFSQSGLAVSWDERGLPAYVSIGVDTSSITGTTGSLLHAEVKVAPNGAITQIVTSGGASEDHALDEFGYTHAVVDPVANVLRFVADASGLTSRMMTYIRDGSGSTSRSFDNVSEPVGSFGETRTDELGRVTRTHEGLFQPRKGTTTTTSGTPIPDPTDHHPPIGALPASTRDLTWPPVGSTTLQDGAWRAGDARSSTDAGFDGWNLPSRIVDDELGYLLIRRNSHAEPIEEIDSTGDITRRTWDAGGNLLAVEIERVSSDPALVGKKVFKLWHDYDALGWRVRTVDGAGNAERWEYDEVGWAARSYDPMGNLTTRTRDGRSRMTSLETKLGKDGVDGGLPGFTPEANSYNQGAAILIQVAYERGGSIKAVTDPAGDRVTWDFDDYGRPTSITYPACVAALGAKTSWSFTFDPTTGFPSTVTDANGTAVRYRYDAAGRLTETRVDQRSPKYPIGGSDGMTFSLEVGSIVAANLDGTAATVATYDSVGLLRSEVQGGRVVGGALQQGRGVEYNYDGAGRRIYLGYPGGLKEVDYKRDASGRVTRVTDGVLSLATYAYLGRERVLRRVCAGITTTYDFADGNGVLKGVRIEGVSGGTIQYALEPDGLGRVKKQTRTVGAGAAEERRWGYDSVGRVVSETTPRATTTRLYDAVDVLREERVTPAGGAQQVSARIAEERGRITQRDGKSISYDLNGNLIDDGARKCGYDAWGRLVQVVRGTATIAYEYDAWNRRIARTLAGHREEYVYDGWQLIEVYLDGTLSERYTWGEQAHDLLFVWLKSTNKTYSVLFTPQGSIDAVVDSSKAIVERYDYTLSGAVAVLDANGAPRPGATPLLRVLFQGHLYDADAGLYDCRSRWYHPELGQFLTPDSADTTGANRYWMNHGDPINFHDPLGLEEEKRYTVFLQGPALRERERQYQYEYNLAKLKKDINSDIAQLQRDIRTEGHSMLRDQLLHNSIERLRDIETWEGEGGAEYAWARDAYDIWMQQNAFRYLQMIDPIGLALMGCGFAGELNGLNPEPPPMRGVPSAPTKSVPIGFRSVRDYQRAHREIMEEEARLAKVNAGKPPEQCEPYVGPRGGMFGYSTRARGLIRQNFARLGLKGEPGHVGVAVGQVNGRPIYRMAGSGTSSPRGWVPEPPCDAMGRPQTVLSYDASTGRFRWGDTEFRTLDELARVLPEGSTGELWLSLEKNPCRSCFGAIRQFQQRFPRITVNAVSRGTTIPARQLRSLGRLPIEESSWFRWHPVD